MMAERLQKDGRRRVRAFAPKTSTGCITCRFRHIKCDEGKPQCYKCTSTGRKCDGYTESTRKSKHLPTKEIAPYATNIVVFSAFPQMHAVPFVGTKQEQRSFYLFQQQTIPQVCGFHNSQFWNHALLQACHHSPAIRHAAIALGSLHEGLALRDSSLSNSHGYPVAEEFALQQYNKAIRLLLKPISQGKGQQSVDVALITCILFICFEALRGYLGSSLAHIDAGVKILLEIQNKVLRGRSAKSKFRSSSTTFAAMSTLNSLFTRLDIQASSMLSERPLQLADSVTPEESGSSGEIPPIFSGFEEARRFQDYIYSHWIRATKLINFDGSKPSAEALSIIKAEYNHKIKAWGSAFDALIDNSTVQSFNHTIEDFQAMNMLQLHRAYMSIYADIDYAAIAEDLTLWDNYTLQFSTMVSHAAALLSTTPSHQQRGLVFSLDYGLISPLYIVASRCRHPRVRRDAIACLSSANRQEGIWRSHLVAIVAQKVVEIEEASVAAEDLDDGRGIPGWARIYDAQAVLDHDTRTATIQFMRKSVAIEGMGILGGNVTETFEW